MNPSVSDTGLGKGWGLGAGRNRCFGMAEMQGPASRQLRSPSAPMSAPPAFSSYGATQDNDNVVVHLSASLPDPLDDRFHSVICEGAVSPLAYHILVSVAGMNSSFQGDVCDTYERINSADHFISISLDPPYNLLVKGSQCYVLNTLTHALTPISDFTAIASARIMGMFNAASEPTTVGEFAETGFIDSTLLFRSKPGSYFGNGNYRNTASFCGDGGGVRINSTFSSPTPTYTTHYVYNRMFNLFEAKTFFVPAFATYDIANKTFKLMSVCNLFALGNYFRNHLHAAISIPQQPPAASQSITTTLDSSAPCSVTSSTNSVSCDDDTGDDGDYVPTSDGDFSDDDTMK